MSNTLARGTYEKKMAYQHFKCWYCGDCLICNAVEIDHIMPKSKHKFGGVVVNLCLACKKCNRKKSDMEVEQFRDYMENNEPDRLIKGKFFFEFLQLSYG